MKLLSLLTKQLRDELSLGVLVPNISAHPFFAHISADSDVTMLRLISTAITELALARDDSLFFCGESGAHMYFVITGELQYVWKISSMISVIAEEAIERRASTVDNKRPLVKKDDWMCEPALWTQWHHVGDVHSMTECTLVVLDSEQFGDVICANGAMWKTSAAYARKYIRYLNGLSTAYISDVAGGSDDYAKLSSFVVDFKGRQL